MSIQRKTASYLQQICRTQVIQLISTQSSPRIKPTDVQLYSRQTELL